MKNNPNYSQPNPAEKLIEVGSKLQQVRLEKSLNLDDLSTKTKISSRLLKAIEEGDIKKLPEPVYIRGLIRRYADTLGLNGAEFVQDFPIVNVMKTPKPMWFSLRLPQPRPIHLYLLYIFVVYCAVNGLSSLVNRSAQESISLASNSTTKVKNNSANKTQELVLVNSEGKKGKPVRIEVTLKAKSWLKIVADGKVQFEGELAEGQKLSWGADQKLTVLAGNAGGVLVALNNEKAKQLGKPGQPQQVTFATNSKS
jgi:cytoskeletal protein RodZ